MMIVEVSGGYIDGAGDLILSKNPSAVWLEGCKNLSLFNLTVLGFPNVKTKIKASFLALKFIWSE